MFTCRCSLKQGKQQKIYVYMYMGPDALNTHSGRESMIFILLVTCERARYVQVLGCCRMTVLLMLALAVQTP